MILAFINQFGRLPIGWLQLRHNKTRFLAAIAGVAFANILIFMQLGFLGALKSSVTFPYRLFEADILVSASDSNTISDGGFVPRVRLYQALSVPEVSQAAALYSAKVDWTPKNRETISFQIYGVSDNTQFIEQQSILPIFHYLNLLDNAIIDLSSRGLDRTLFQDVRVTTPQNIEVNGRTLHVVGGFDMGGGFDADGYLIVSDQTFANLLPVVSLRTPKHILIQIKHGANVEQVIQEIKRVFQSDDTLVRSYQSAIDSDQQYQTTKRPVGVVFGFGCFIGVLVGLVIVYQVLASDVADHLKEYATFKAIGYSSPFFNSIILEEAVILAVSGFIPGVCISVLLYKIIGAVTGLPISMGLVRVLAVFIGTLLMCLSSGLLATKKLHHANPADLF
jgi:putative ABC transport system permease protein